MLRILLQSLVLLLNIYFNLIYNKNGTASHQSNIRRVSIAPTSNASIGSINYEMSQHREPRARRGRRMSLATPSRVIIVFVDSILA